MKKTALILAVVFGITLSAHLAFAEETGSGATGTAGADSGVTAPETIKKNLELQNEAAKEALEQRKKEVENKKGALEERRKEMTAKKDELNQKMMERSREQAKKLLEQLKRQLENLRERIKSSEKGLSESDVSALAAAIDAEIGKIEALKEKIGQAQTREDVRNLGQEIKDKVKVIRKYSLTFHSRLMAIRIGQIIEKLEKKIAVIEQKIGDLKAAGRDTAGLEAIIAEAKGHIAEAKRFHNEAKAKFISGLTAESADGAIKEAADLAKEANKHIILAHRSLQSLIPAINKLIRPQKGEEPETTTPPAAVPPVAVPPATTTTP